MKEYLVIRGAWGAITIGWLLNVYSHIQIENELEHYSRLG